MVLPARFEGLVSEVKAPRKRKRGLARRLAK